MHISYKKVAFVQLAAQSFPKNTCTLRRTRQMQFIRKPFGLGIVIPPLKVGNNCTDIIGIGGTQNKGRTAPVISSFTHNIISLNNKFVENL